MVAAIAFGKETMMAIRRVIILTNTTGGMKIFPAAGIITILPFPAGAMMTGGHGITMTDGIITMVITIIKKMAMTAATEIHGSIDQAPRPIIRITGNKTAQETTITGEIINAGETTCLANMAIAIEAGMMIDRRSSFH
jgi:hypothetical protein